MTGEASSIDKIFEGLETAVAEVSGAILRLESEKNLLQYQNQILRERLANCWHAANDYNGEPTKALDAVMSIAGGADRAMKVLQDQNEN